MKLGYYHYYFKKKRTRNAPRVCHSIKTILDAYIEYNDVDWKKQFEMEDGEKLMLVPTSSPDVYMLIATRQQEIIKAISTENLSCTDIQHRLEENETTGFAAYFTVSDDYLALASTLRGPRTAALHRFVQEILNRLGAHEWKFNISPIGTSITLDQAQGLAFVASSQIRVGPQNDLHRHLKELFAVDTDDIASFEIKIRGKRTKNLKDVFAAMAEKTSSEDIRNMTVKARRVAEDALIDYHVETEGRFSDEISNGDESHIAQSIRSKIAQNTELTQLLEKSKEDAVYENLDIQNLNNLSNVTFWSNFLRDTNERTTEPSPETTHA